MPGRQVQDAGRSRRRMWLRLTLAALVVSLGGLIAVTIEFVAEAQATLRQVAVQAQLSIRLRELQGVLVGLGDAEAGQRGYLLTGDPRYLAPYHAAAARLPVLLSGLDLGLLESDSADRHVAEAR